MEPSRREIQKSHSPLGLRGDEHAQVRWRAGRERLRVEHCPRRHDSRDRAAHQTLGRARIFDLVADGHLSARRHQPGDVMVGALMRDAAHRRLDVGVLVPGGERDPQERRGLFRVVEEHLVEVPHPIKEDCVRRLALHLEVLPEHGRRARRGSAHLAGPRSVKRTSQAAMLNRILSPSSRGTFGRTSIPNGG